MSRSRIYAVIIALTLVFGLVAINFASAGETVKIEGTATSINTKWHEIEVGDV